VPYDFPAARLAVVEDRLDIANWLFATHSRSTAATLTPGWPSSNPTSTWVGMAARGRYCWPTSPPVTVVLPVATYYLRSPYRAYRNDTMATGRTYCRAEHEVADRFVVMGFCYDDIYAKV
jgi:hypothetical protein